MRHHADMTDDLQMAMARFQECIERRDRPTAEGVLDEGYALVLVHPSPATVPRARWLDVLADYRVHSYQVDESVLDLDGDVAVALQRVQMAATVLGEDRSGGFVITDVWRRRPEGWKVWRRHSTPLAAGDMPGA
jgi:hypothetical protein